jgi:hypothetical protein
MKNVCVLFALALIAACTPRQYYDIKVFLAPEEARNNGSGSGLNVLTDVEALINVPLYFPSPLRGAGDIYSVNFFPLEGSPEETILNRKATLSASSGLLFESSEDLNFAVGTTLEGTLILKFPFEEDYSPELTLYKDAQRTTPNYLLAYFDLATTLDNDQSVTCSLKSIYGKIKVNVNGSNVGYDFVDTNDNEAGSVSLLKYAVDSAKYNIETRLYTTFLNPAGGSTPLFRTSLDRAGLELPDVPGEGEKGYATFISDLLVPHSLDGTTIRIVTAEGHTLQYTVPEGKEIKANSLLTFDLTFIRRTGSVDVVVVIKVTTDNFEEEIVSETVSVEN